MRLQQLVEAPIPVSKKQSDELKSNNNDNVIVDALRQAKRACSAILLTQPALYRGAQNLGSFADRKYYLPNEFVLYEFSGRQSPRSSATGNNMMQSLSKIHPEWTKLNFPRRDLSIFAANKEVDAATFGQVGIVIPFDSVVKFAITKDDFNLKRVHQNNNGSHHLLRMQNAVISFLGGLEALLADTRKALEHAPSVEMYKSLAAQEHLSDSQFKTYLTDNPLISAVLKHGDWLSSTADRTMEWKSSDLKILDELYSLWLSNSNVFTNYSMTSSATLKMASAFGDKMPSQIMHKSMHPKTLGAEVTDFNGMLTSIRSSELKEVWFEGPYFILTNHGDTSMRGERIKEWAESDQWMNNILTRVTG